MTLPVERPLTPMLARSENDLPSGSEWLYEPKWDGFRALIYKDEDHVEIMSRNGKPLTSYFPDVAAAAKRELPARCVIDGEVVACDEHGNLSFDRLLARLNPRQAPQGAQATFIAFDLLALGHTDLRSRPFALRRKHLERSLRRSIGILPTPQTHRRDAAMRWLRGFRSHGIEGVIAKPRDLHYAAGRRLMVKVRSRNNLDCVVGGFVPDHSDLPAVLLLGLYAEDGVLDHIGQTTVLPARQRLEAQSRLQRRVGAHGFVDGLRPSRWQEQRERPWISVQPEIVCEVAYTAVDSGRLRHAATLIRWRDDRSGEGCSERQLR